MRAGVYARISDDREGEALGVARQLKEGRGLVVQRGGEVVLERQDNDISALRGKRRPGYDDIMAAAEAGQITHIVVYHTSRFWRNRRERADGIERLQHARVSVVAVKGPDLDMSTAYGRGMAGLIGEFDTMESEVKSERILSKVRELAADGKIGNGGPRPFGYRRIYSGDGVRRKIIRDEIEPTEAAIVQELAYRCLGGETLRSLVMDLNERGIRTSGGKLWSLQAMRYMLIGARIAGLREHGRGDDGRPGGVGIITGPAVWPAIIDRETHEQLRAKLAANQPQRGSKVRIHYLSGFLYCSSCAHENVRMKVAPRYGKLRYICPSKGDGGCGGRVIMLPPLVDLMDKYMIGRLCDPRTLRLLSEREATDDTEAQTLLDQIDGDERRLGLLQDNLADGGEDELPEVFAAVRRIRKRLSGARHRLAQITGGHPVLGESLPDLGARWCELHLDKKRLLLGMLVDRVLIGPAVRGRATFDPTRVQIVERQ